jgi:hypothetical protein
VISFECILARLTSYVPVPAFAVNGEEQVLQNVFAEASNADIQLGINNAQMDPPLSNHRGFFGLDLHLALAALTKNKPPAPAKRIAVLFADYYTPFQPAFGVMFDRGFSTPDDPSTAKAYQVLPREGCAVFLGAIADQRQSERDREDEALFTTIHELGHVFNLQHANFPPNFLAQSGAKPYPVEAFNFLQQHQAMLSQCSRSPFICPGGSPFEQTGTFANLNVIERRSSPPPEFGLELEVSMTRREFWAFEPVELDIELRVAPGVERTFRVPDAIDPGYETFDIWIEEPSGERRKYRSPRRYCGVRRARRIAPGKPFRRDVSIFGEAGGYTFRSAGVHRLWATFTVTPKHSIRSNDIEINVLPAQQSDDYDRAELALAPGRRSSVLYHRLMRGTRRRDVSMLNEYAEETGSRGSAGAVQYALGRAMIELARRTGQQTPKVTGELLRKARDHDGLSRRQREIAEELVSSNPI